MRAWLSRYHPSFLRTLVYMLQASEYDTRDYLGWLRRTKDFSNVARRKQFVMTTKARLLLYVLWVMVGLAGSVIAGLLLAALVSGWLIWWLIGTAIVFVITPWMLAYGLILPLALGEHLIQKPQEGHILAAAQLKLAAHPALKIAITGSYGKTTFKETLKTILATGKEVAAAPASYNTPLGVAKFIEQLTGAEEVLIFELAENFPLAEFCRLIKPNIGIITGINEAHAEKLGSLEVVTRNVFDLGEFTQTTYVNAENDLANRAAKPAQIQYSRRGAGEWHVSEAQTSLGGTSFIAASANKKIAAKSKLLGLHQIGPLVAMIDLADGLGLSTDQIEKGIAKTQPFEHRLQLRRDPSGVVTIDDSYNGNPDGVKAVIEFLKTLKGHRRWYVTPGLVEMGERTADVHREIGRQLAAAEIEKVVLFRNSVTPFIEEGLQNAGFKGELTWFDDALKGFAALTSMTVSGDVVLLQNDWPDNYA